MCMKVEVYNQAPYFFNRRVLVLRLGKWSIDSHLPKECLKVTIFSQVRKAVQEQIPLIEIKVLAREPDLVPRKCLEHML